MEKREIKIALSFTDMNGILAARKLQKQYTQTMEDLIRNFNVEVCSPKEARKIWSKDNKSLSDLITQMREE
ncbi:hypothetical protein H8E77_09005 [bacterium]|nr:hypothetical protein [bacterium]